MYKAFIAMHLLLENGYPGGLTQFDEDQNLYCAIPPLGETKPHLYFYLKKNETIVKGLFSEDTQRMLDCDVTFVDKLNFEGMAKDEASEGVDEAVQANKERLAEARIDFGVTGNQLMLTFTLPDYPTGQQLEVLTDVIKQIKGLIRAQIATIQGIIPVDLNPKSVAIHTAILEVPKRERILDGDAITDVKILLGTCETVDDFINNM